MNCVIGDVRQLFDHPDFPDLLAEYSAECVNRQLPMPNPSRELYVRLEATGVLTVWMVVDGDRLVGFASALRTVLPHYSREMVIVESVFVSKRSRANGAGTLLLKNLEASAAGTGLLLSAPAGSQMEKVLHARKYACTNTVFCKWLSVDS